MQFFGARALSVFLLGCTLLLTYGICRLLAYRRGAALFFTAAVGYFPMTSFMSSYVQPDNLAFTLVSLVLYLTLLARRRPGRAWVIGLLGLALAALLVTKVHYYLCVLLPVLAMLGTEWLAHPGRRPRPVRAALALALPSLVLGATSAWTVWGCENVYAFYAKKSAPGPELPLALYVTRGLAKGVLDYYAGTTHQSFWGVFGSMDAPLVIRDRHVTEFVQFILQAAAWVMLGLTLLRLEQVVSRLARVARRGRGRLALRIACSNPVVNSYFVFTVFMVGLYVRLDNQFGAQGRNWLPFLPAFFLVGVTYAPRALSARRGRRAVAACVVAGLLLYVAAGSYYAVKSVRQRFYPAVPRPVALSVGRDAGAWVRMGNPPRTF